MNEYAKIFKFKDGNKDKSHKLMFFRTDFGKFCGLSKIIWTKIEGLLNSKVFDLRVYDDRYTKTKKTTYSDKNYTNFCSLNVSKDGGNNESYTNIYIVSLPFYDNNFYLKVHLDNCIYEIVNNEMRD